jgi:hypothetical protein
MKYIIQVFLGSMSLAQAIASETTNIKPELLVEVSDIELL